MYVSTNENERVKQRKSERTSTRVWEGVSSVLSLKAGEKSSHFAIGPQKGHKGLTGGEGYSCSFRLILKSQCFQNMIKMEIC